MNLIEPNNLFIFIDICSVKINNPHPNPHLLHAFANELYSVKMFPGKGINSHLIMMNLKFQKANLLGIDLSKEQWVQFILNSLLPEYNRFFVSYMINNFNLFDVDKLDAELRVYEQTLPARRPPSSFEDMDKMKAVVIENDASDNAASSSSILRARIKIEPINETIREQMSKRILLCSYCGEKGHSEERYLRLLDHWNEAA
ncbi:uncharacterized protein LOC115720650 [Cannabis sativa]|uniref:uncharacterized protein LOC115720650 n=1 Tax=Cannabis sativa TaxID=3483 RepID=UPI0029C9D2B7|nr:uncharacterized protein LOC115720650 [Cannabis sativa]